MTPPKKIVKKAVKKPIKRAKKVESLEDLDESILDYFRGSGMTAQQKTVQDNFIKNFIGNLVSAVDNSIKAGIVSVDAKPKPAASAVPQQAAPTPQQVAPAPQAGKAQPRQVLKAPAKTAPKRTAKPAAVTEMTRYEKLNKIFESILAEQQGQMAVTDYIYDQFLPRYVKSWNSLDQLVKTQIKKWSDEIGKNWGSAGARRAPMTTLAGLLFTNIHLPQMQASGDQQQAGAQPQAAQSPAAKQATTDVNTALGTISKNIKKLTPNQVKRLKNYVAKLQ